MLLPEAVAAQTASAVLIARNSLYNSVCKAFVVC